MKSAFSLRYDTEALQLVQVPFGLGIEMAEEQGVNLTTHQRYMLMHATHFEWRLVQLEVTMLSVRD